VLTRIADVADRTRERVWRVLHRLFFARLGYGAPVARSVWEDQYRKGEWDFLYSDAERAHYDAIVSLVANSSPPERRILDVGCGHGRLLELLRARGFGSYTGVDIAAPAIEKARALAVPGASFAVADFQKWQPEGTYDAIVFNESLYYAARPYEVARRYADLLAREGHLIVSAVDYGDMSSMWRKLQSAFAVIDERVVSNERGQQWTIKVLTPNVTA
jgi:2-polyprenyl-3-methyl-5-hydroxy-6-metoxy-1,4-benzoquinol methylase